MWLSLSYVETTNKPHGIFRTIPSLTTLFSSVPADSESASTVQGHAHQTWAYICFNRSNVFPREAVSRHEAGWLGALSSPSHSQKHTSEQRRHSPRDSCSSVWSTNPLHQWSSSLGKYLRYLSVKWSKSPPFVPARKRSRGLEFVFPIRLHAARPLPSPSQVGLINGLSSQHNEVQRGVGLLGRSPNSFCRRITFGPLCTIKQRTWGSLIYQVGSEDNYFSSSRYTQSALTTEAKWGSWGIQTLFTFRWNWISELYTKLGRECQNRMERRTGCYIEWLTD